MVKVSNHMLKYAEKKELAAPYIYMYYNVSIGLGLHGVL